MYDVHLAFRLSRCMLSTIMAFPRKTSPEAIREAAITLLKNEGPDALTLRKVASALGVVPNALYRHFPSRDALIAAVGDEAARELLRRMTDAVGGHLDPEDRIRALAKAYTDYADEQWAMHSMILANTADGEATLPGLLGKPTLWSFVVDELALLTGPNEAPQAAVTVWAVLQGMITLKRARLMGGRRPEDIGGYPLDVVLKGLRGNSEPEPGMRRSI